MGIVFGVNTSTRGALRDRNAYMQVGQAADGLGYGFLSINDHVVVPRDIASRYPYSEEGSWSGRNSGFNLDQLTTLAFLAGCTERIRLMSSVMVVPHRQPVLAAKIISTADVLSNGRIIVGCGAGWMKEEFEALEAKPYAERGLVTDEYIAAFKQLWTKDDPVFKGKHVSFDNLMFEPKPVQKPHPPVWIGGESQPAMRRAVALGDAWYPGSVNPAARLDTPARLGKAIGDLHKMCAIDKRDPATLGVSHVVLSPVDWAAQPGHDTPRRAFTGSAADMAADAAALAALGISHVNLTFQTASLNETLERIERFAKEVIPLVK
jgi:probable F420-dependent oxidoreductase